MPKRRPIVVAALSAAVVTGILAVASSAAFSPASVTAGGWTTSAQVTPTSVAQGVTVSIAARVSSASQARALVDIEVYNANGAKVAQAFWDAQSFTAGTASKFTTNWVVPQTETMGQHVVKIGIFSDGWGTLLHWNNGAATFNVSAPAPPPSTTNTSTSTTSTSTTSTTAAPPAGHFSTLAPGSALPSDATCAAEVRPASETKSGNATYNATKGTQKNLTGPYPTFSRVDGNFTGTTDEILQWVACKWGIDEDVVRAQAAVESWWNQTNLGDWGTDATACAPGYPINVDPAGHPGQCPQSVGILQDRYPYWSNGFPQAETSTAYNADYAYAAWRACYEGEEGWLNTVDRVGTYGPGDLWGCIGVWYSGRWHTTAAEGYISKVQSYLSQKVWTQASFVQ